MLDQLAAAVDGGSNALAGCQTHIPLHPRPDASTTRFAHNAGCPACHGGFGPLFHDSPETFPASASGGFTREDVPTCRLDNGHRALDSRAARGLVESAIDRMGATMQVRELRTGLLDDVIPSSRAELSTPGKTGVLGTGKGVDKNQAYLSAAFEAVERLCSEPRGNVPLLRAPRNAVRDRTLDVQRRIGTVLFYRNNEPFAESTPVDWVWGQCLYTGQPILVPASMVYVGLPKFAGKFYNASTGGIAAGTLIEDAVLQGLMETSEHDAWMIWQANGIACPEIRKSSSPSTPEGCNSNPFCRLNRCSTWISSRQARASPTATAYFRSPSSPSGGDSGSPSRCRRIASKTSWNRRQYPDAAQAQIAWSGPACASHALIETDIAQLLDANDHDGVGGGVDLTERIPHQPHLRRRMNRRGEASPTLPLFTCRETRFFTLAAGCRRPPGLRTR